MNASPERIDHLLSRLGYCSRSEVRDLLRAGRVAVDAVPLRHAQTKVLPSLVTLDGAPLDHPQPLYILYHKPLGKVCAHDDARGIYADFPERWRLRRPCFASVGRLDKETSGLLLLTDDGDWLHRLIAPRFAVPRRYRVQLQSPLQGHEAEQLASGTLLLEGEKYSCRPAELAVLGDQEVLLTLREGRYHEVRRIFAALGNVVMALHRESYGDLTLAGLEPGAWRELTRAERPEEGP